MALFNTSWFTSSCHNITRDWERLLEADNLYKLKLESYRSGESLLNYSSKKKIYKSRSLSELLRHWIDFATEKGILHILEKEVNKMKDDLCKTNYGINMKKLYHELPTVLAKRPDLMEKYSQV